MWETGIEGGKPIPPPIPKTIPHNLKPSIPLILPEKKNKLEKRSIWSLKEYLPHLSGSTSQSALHSEQRRVEERKRGGG